MWKVDGERAQVVATLAAEGHNTALDVAFAPDGRTVALARGGGWGAGMSLAPAGETRVPLWDLGAFNPGPATRTAATAPAGE